MLVSNRSSWREMIRNIKLEDASEIQKICKLSLGYDVDTRLIELRIRNILNDTAHHIIAVYEDENANRVVGFVHAEVYECLYSEVGVNILGLAVHPQFQGKGIGKKLMEYVEAYALDNDFCFVRLNSGSQRTEAHKFYEKIGYTCDKTQKRFIKRL